MSTMRATTVSIASNGPTPNFLGTIDSVDLVVRTHNIEKMRVKATGNVGLGTSAPASLLHVRSTMRLGLTGQANGGLIFNNTAGNIITFNTPTSMSNQVYTLPTAVGANGNVLTYTTGGQLIWGSGGTATDDWRLNGNNNATDSSKLGTLNNKPLMIYANNAERMRVATNGNVGIKETTPYCRLHVRGDVGGFKPVARFQVTGSGTDTYLEIGNNNTTSDFEGYIKGRTTQTTDRALTFLAEIPSGADSGTEPIMMFQSSKGADVTTRPLFSWRDNGIVQMQMDATGNLGIGTLAGSIAAKLHVKDGNVYVQNGNVGIGTASPSGKLHVAGTVFAALATGSGNPVQLDINNQLVENTSTINHKTNVEDLVFDRVAFFSLRPVSYKWKEAHGGHEDIGLIAEEVEQHLPIMVNYGYKRTYVDEVTGELLRDSMGVPVIDTTQLQPWGVDYRKISIYLMALAKEQDALFNNMADRLNEVESAIENCCNFGPSYRMASNESGKDSNHGIQLKVYPNPNDGNFTIDYSLEEGRNAKLYLVTTSGQKMLLSDNVLSKGKEDFNISGPSGVYQVILEDTSGVVLQATKIVITR